MYRKIKNKSKKTIYYKKSAYEAFANIFNSLSRVGSSLIALGIFAYIIGWLQAKSYFDVMGATWILKDFSIYDLLFYSWISFFPIVILIYNAVQEITEKGEEKTKEINFMLTKGTWVLIILFISMSITMSLNYLTLSEILSIMVVIFLFLYINSAIEALILEIQNKKFKWNYYSTAIVYGIIFFGVYLAPTNLGKLNGLKDKNLQKTTLPIVITKDQKDNEYRLLFNKENRFYLIKITKSEYPEVYIENINNIKKIVKNN